MIVMEALTVVALNQGNHALMSKPISLPPILLRSLLPLDALGIAEPQMNLGPQAANKARVALELLSPLPHSQVPDKVRIRKCPIHQ